MVGLSDSALRLSRALLLDDLKQALLELSDLLLVIQSFHEIVDILSRHHKRLLSRS